MARQLRALDKSGDRFFAPAPPLEALRIVLSMAMTRIGSHVPDWNGASRTRCQVSLVDIKRAYFNAKIDPRDPPTFVQLPDEDPDSGTMCAQLLRHMYGTRMAADGWQEEYSTFLVSIGFRQGEACPNLFYHRDRQVVTSIHGTISLRLVRLTPWTGWRRRSPSDTRSRLTPALGQDPTTQRRGES